MIAKVITDISLDRTFDYLVPPDLEGKLRPGSAVTVPFGHSRRSGYVVELADRSEFEKLRPISEAAAGRASIPPPLIKLGLWIADYYCATGEQALRTLLPAAVRSGKVREKTRRIYFPAPAELTERFFADKGNQPRYAKQAATLKVLQRYGEAARVEFAGEPEFSAGAFDTLVKSGLICFREERVSREVFSGAAVVPDRPRQPTADQAAALAMVREMLQPEASCRTLLLHGVTDSGKTEVYLQSIDLARAQGRSAIVLVPEISLTPQTVGRFRARFGDRISILHSRMSDGERFDQWNKINRGEVDIAIGARSALFAPFTNLGLIIVDEEHDSSYKQSEAPRYHARDVAVVRGQLEKALVILGSATPSAESLHNVAAGKFRCCRMTVRVGNRPMPRVTVVDRRLDIVPGESGKNGLLSPILIEAVKERLLRGEQSILFLNRLGYARSLCCPQCGFEARCPDCSVNYTYTYSRSREVLTCHLCGATLPAPEICPQCGSPEIRYLGSGTEKLESCAHAVFPRARVGRMDSDQMRSADDYEVILNKMRAGKIDILIGTQMIAKGLHFPNVTLVGVVNADQGLAMPDFRAQERTFQLLTQVAGRAGRGEVPGEVIFQTFRNSEVINFAAQQDYEGFSKFDSEFREMLGYPPFTRIIAIIFRGEKEAAVADFAAGFAAALEPYRHDRIKISAPAPAPIEKIRNQFRYLLLIRGTGLARIRAAVRELAFHRPVPAGITIAVDADPQSLM